MTTKIEFMKIRGGRWFIDYLVAGNCWKNYAVCKTEEKALEAQTELREKDWLK